MDESAAAAAGKGRNRHGQRQKHGDGDRRRSSSGMEGRGSEGVRGVLECSYARRPVGSAPLNFLRSQITWQRFGIEVTSAWHPHQSKPLLQPVEDLHYIKTRKQRNIGRKRKSDDMRQNPASPMDMIVVNGSSISNQEPEVKKKSKKKMHAEDGKHSNSIRSLKSGLIIEDLSTGNLDAQKASDGSKVTVLLFDQIPSKADNAAAVFASSCLGEIQNRGGEEISPAAYVLWPTADSGSSWRWVAAAALGRRGGMWPAAAAAPPLPAAVLRRDELLAPAPLTPSTSATVSQPW